MVSCSFIVFCKAHIGYYVNVKYSNNSNWDRWETQGSKVTILSSALYWWAEWFGSDNVAPKLKSPQGFRGQRLEAQSRQQLWWPRAGSFFPRRPEILPINTRINATEQSPRDVKPGLPYVVVQAVYCTRVPAEGVSGSWNIAHALLINLCSLVMDSIHMEDGTLLSNLHNSIWASRGPVRSNGDSHGSQSLALRVDTFIKHTVLEHLLCARPWSRDWGYGEECK